MGTGSRGRGLGIKDEVIKKACSVSNRAHKAPAGKLFLVEKIRGCPSQVVFAFSGAWTSNEWSAQDGKARAFGETEVNLDLFPSLRSIGNDITATVNKASMTRFLQIMEKSALRSEVEKAMRKSKPIIFAGHSSGGPIAIYATIWWLEKYKRLNKTPSQTHGPFCLTFGSPLTTDRIFCHAVRREEWSDRFVHFVMIHDIVPKILLAPLSSTKYFLEQILPYFLTSTHHKVDSIDKSKLTALFDNVKMNASCVADNAARILICGTNEPLDAKIKSEELSPYRPCGQYVFCTGTGRLVVVKNPDAVFQLLFHSLQLISDSEPQETAVTSIQAHLAYEDGLDKNLDMRNAVHLENLQELPLSSDNTADIVTKTIDDTLNDLNLSWRARMCLRAAGESEKQKEDNQMKIGRKVGTIENDLSYLEGYRTVCKTRGMGYFDAFKVQKHEDDFKANVKKLELEGIWDEIIKMLKRDELPDKYEAGERWVKLGTRFRQLVEPLDIANYYRHLKNKGPYMTKGRLRCYKYTQRWREHDEQLPRGSCGESCFWADVEELNLALTSKKPRNEQMALNLANKLKEWHAKGEVEKDAFLKETALVKWWQTLPDNHGAKLCIKDLIES